MKHHLFAIKKHYADLILSGEKLSEIRTGRVNIESGDAVAIYESRGSKSVTGVFIVGQVRHFDPHDLPDVDAVCRRACVAPEEFAEYFARHKTGTEIGVLGPLRRNGATLDALGMRAPQRFMRITREAFDYLSYRFYIDFCPGCGSTTPRRTFDAGDAWCGNCGRYQEFPARKVRA